MIADGTNLTRIAATFGTSQPVISNIKNGKTYKAYDTEASEIE